MTDTSTYVPQTDPAGDPDPRYGHQRDAWPLNQAYPAGAGQWPPASPGPSGPAIPSVPSVPPAPPTGLPGTADTSPRRGRRRAAAAALVAAIAIASGVAGGVVGARLDDAAGIAGTGTGERAATAAVASADSLAGVVAAVSPSIVTVKVATGQGTAEGSGIVLTSAGRIVTNYHVVEDASGRASMTVTLDSGRTVAASVLGTDPSADLAVLQAQDVSGLTPATLGDSSALRVGDTVLAFGSPLGLEGTVTSGIVSAVDRSLSSQSESLSGLLQTDAPINAGNSGGALVDTAGRVIGVNVAIATTGQDSGNIGVGFAIPVNTVKTIVEQITNSR